MMTCGKHTYAGMVDTNISRVLKTFQVLDEFFRCHLSIQNTKMALLKRMTWNAINWSGSNSVDGTLRTHLGLMKSSNIPLNRSNVVDGLTGPSHPLVLLVC